MKTEPYKIQSDLLRITLCGGFHQFQNYFQEIKQVMQSKTQIGEAFFTTRHEDYVMKGYQEGSGSSSIGRHLLTEMIKELVGCKRNESEYMLNQKESYGFSDAIEAIKTKFKTDYDQAVLELGHIRTLTNNLIRANEKIIDERYLPLYRKLTTGDIQGRVSSEKVHFLTNLISSYSFSNHSKHYPGNHWTNTTMKRLVPIEQIIIHSGIFELESFTTEENEVIIFNPEHELKITTEAKIENYPDYKPELLKIIIPE
ncbi:hypothetical protein [Priestia megaterium]|uniref:hypothetical protein n=1 Tax=Priestia megaterium TaxID=1404 RepID=UPI0012B88293|nr:hypothetical protein [Priestia megaterium]